MLEICSEDGFRLLSLDPEPGNGLSDPGRALELVSFLLEARAALDLPTLAAEVFFPLPGGLERTLSLPEGKGLLSWKCSVREPLDDAALAVLLSLAGSLPALEELASEEIWLGGLYRLEHDASWAQALEACGLKREKTAAVLERCRSCQVELSLDDERVVLPLMPKAEPGPGGAFVLEVHPLALYALLGLDAQYCLDDAAEVLERPFAWEPGLLTLVCALGELLPVEDELDEASDEFSADRLALLVTGPDTDPAAGKDLWKTLERLMKLAGRLNGWQARAFNEIAEQRDGLTQVNPGGRVWRVTHVLP